MTTQPLDIEALRARLQANMLKSAQPKKMPRCFDLGYDRTKVKNANPAKRLEYKNRLHMYGTRFPSGSVVLENGAYFETWNEFEVHFGLMGEYEVQWVDEMEASK